jgi:hypothetical protein
LIRISLDLFSWLRIWDSFFNKNLFRFRHKSIFAVFSLMKIHITPRITLPASFTLDFRISDESLSSWITNLD